MTRPLPSFAETFLDNGYGDVYAILPAAVRAGYAGTVILDRTPSFEPAAGPGAPTAFAVGYMKAAIWAAQAELAIGSGGKGGEGASDA